MSLVVKHNYLTEKYDVCLHWHFSTWLVENTPALQQVGGKATLHLSITTP